MSMPLWGYALYILLDTPNIPPEFRAFAQIIERHKPVTSQTRGTKIGHNDKLRDASAITVRPDGVSMATGELQRHSAMDR